MRERFLPLIFCVFSFSVFAQSTSSIGVWLDHLPYGGGVDVLEVNNTVYVATEQGLFTYKHDEKTLNRFSKVNGLSDIDLTSIAWAQKYQMLIIGYENGNIDLIQGENVTNVQDIKFAGNYSGLKRINEIEVMDDVAYFCTNFGIVAYDLDRNIVLETFIIGENGSILGVNDLAITADSVYAATAEGLLVAGRATPLIDYANWRKVESLGEKINFVVNFDETIYVNKIGASTNDSIYFRDGGSWKYAAQIDALFMGKVVDMKEDKGYLLISNIFSSAAYDSDFAEIQKIFPSNLEDGVLIPAAASIGNNPERYWVADQNKGLIAWIKYDGTFSYSEIIKPNSPASRNALRMYHDDNKLYVAPGTITPTWAPGFNNDGYFELEEYVWTNHLPSEAGDFQDIVAFVSDLEDPGHLYASSYGNGILEFQDGQFVQLINSENSDMTPMGQGKEQRIGGFARDMEGNIWFTNSLTDQPLGVLRTDGSVEMFSLGSAANSSSPVKNIMYTSQDQLWLQVRNDGIVVIQVEEGKVNQGKIRLLTSSEGSGDLPTETVLSFAEDLDGEIWIGTNEGIAVLYSPQNIFEAERNYDAQIIVIDADDDGAGDRVLGAEVINDIEVDGSNKKWFGTANSGAFYTSENGKEQIYNFTVDNSPLPSNNIMDIEIDDITGMVYFATDQGIVSFQGGATRGVESHTDVFAYPNPVEPHYEGPILIRGLVTNAQVKITDIEGNIVYETVAEGGQAIWSGKRFDGERVKSGVYLAFITNDDGSATAVTKIMIVN